jgi:hypothetical protein
MNPFMYIGLPRSTQLAYVNREKPLLQIITKEFALQPGDLKLKSRKQEIVGGRHLYSSIMYHMYSYMSITDIGKDVGVDHATVLHGCKMTALFLVQEPEYRRKAIAVMTSFLRLTYPKMADWFIVKQTKAMIERLMINESRQERNRRRSEQTSITLPSRMSEVESA